MPDWNMNVAVPLPSGIRAHNPLRTMPLRTRTRQRVSRRCRFLYLKLKTSVSWSDVLRVFLGLALVILLYTSAKQLWPQHDTFDDIVDMMRFEQMRHIALNDYKNRSDDMHTSDITRTFNMTQVRMARAQWNYAYRELMHRAKTPVLTNEERQQLYWLLRIAKYTMKRSLKTTLHVTCNYINHVADDPADLSTFMCAPTSHRCPDGAFENTTGLTPAEGDHVSWDDVVIVIMLSANRSEYTSAITETWIRRLDLSATIVIVRDREEPALPEFLQNRPNVIIHDYAGPLGLDNLDVKVATTWNFVMKRFEESGKKYFIKIDDDAYLVAHNLMRFLTKLDRWFGSNDEPLYFGHPFCGHGDLEALDYGHWCYAGGGAYGLNIEALGMMVRQIAAGCDYFNKYVKSAQNYRPVNDVYGGRYEDVMVARCLRQAKNRAQLNGTSLLACGSFFPYAPLHYFRKFGRDVKAVTKKMDDSAITLHNLMPSAMRYLDMFLYEYPIGGISPFSEQNLRLEGELLRICHLQGKKMRCDWPPHDIIRENSTTLFKQGLIP